MLVLGSRGRTTRGRSEEDICPSRKDSFEEIRPSWKDGRSPTMNREELPTEKEVIQLIREMNHAAEWFQNDAPALCKRGAHMIEVLHSFIHKKVKE